MSMFGRKSEPMVEMPREVNVPVPTEDQSNGGAVSAWAPKRYNVVPQQDQAQQAIEQAVSVLNNYREQVGTLEAQLHDKEVRIGILEGRCSDLELTNAQLRNDLVVSRTAETDAKREASDWLSLWQNVAAMISNFEIGAMPPSTARKRVRKAQGGENGTESTGVALATETPIGEAPKPEETNG